MNTYDYEASGQHRKLTYDCTKTPETKRVYLFPGGDRIEIEGVVIARASRHGNHSLTLADGTVTVVAWGWLTLTFPGASQVAPKEVVERCENAWIEHLTPEAKDRDKAVASSPADTLTLAERFAGSTQASAGNSRHYTAQRPSPPDGQAN
jgi:hypothetical protein